MVQCCFTASGRPSTFSWTRAVFIEAETTILLDTGPSVVVLENARLAGIDLKRTEWIVLSHGHWDHADGLLALAESGTRPKLICHPGVFVDRRKPVDEFNGVTFDRDRAADMFLKKRCHGCDSRGSAYLKVF
jgi:7,8-dihydropterin-6-yl-methyl-4-(beta-D-ribofuranosyl)aminobenzene 5'-phosphate synthase